MPEGALSKTGLGVSCAALGVFAMVRSTVAVFEPCVAGLELVGNSDEDSWNMAAGQERGFGSDDVGFRDWRSRVHRRRRHGRMEAYSGARPPRRAMASLRACSMSCMPASHASGHSGEPCSMAT